MYNFSAFADALARHFDDISSDELFRVDITADEMWDAYLSSFPEGTNPIFRVRTHHDGSYDRSVVKRIGNVVAIRNYELVSVWDLEGLEYPYDVVAKTLSDKVKAAFVSSVFRINEKRIGHKSSLERLEDGGVYTWNHFYANIAKRHQSQSVNEQVGRFKSKVDVLKRGLEELTPAAMSTIQDLIENGALYRGDENKRAVNAFAKLLDKYQQLNTVEDKNVAIWAWSSSPAAGFRNTAIGTLAVDLSEDMDLELAVKRFEEKVAPGNYKRPKALITKRMVEDAMKTIRELDLEASLERRHAQLSDVSVNNVIWVGNDAQRQMKDGIEGLLQAEVQPSKPKSDAEEISIEDFIAKVLPQATEVEAYFSNRLQKNLVNITAPVHEDAPLLFRWDNGFAWSYAGNTTDSDMRHLVSERGGRVDGVFRFTHMWNYDTSRRNASLMDLHVFMPGHKDKKYENTCNDRYGTGRRVGWNSRTDVSSKGVQDVDYVEPAPAGFTPVENITFPELRRMPEGKYVCMVHNWERRSPNEGGFKAEIEFEGNVFTYEVKRPLENKEWIPVATVTLKNGRFSIKHHLPCDQTSQEIWGIHTERFAPVTTFMFSPNHWDDQQIGNKHYFFLLEGCGSDEPVRGIYNEFLRPDLEKHRKVFEVLGTKTKCDLEPTQLAGLGFSSTQREQMTVHVTGPKFNRMYNIQF